MGLHHLRLAVPLETHPTSKHCQQTCAGSVQAELGPTTTTLHAAGRLQTNNNDHLTHSLHQGLCNPSVHQVDHAVKAPGQLPLPHPRRVPYCIKSMSASKLVQPHPAWMDPFSPDLTSKVRTLG